jgi:hypothetical protein
MTGSQITPNRISEPHRIRAAMRRDRFPLLYGEDCSVLLAAVSALAGAAGPAGLVFVDDHEDATPMDLSLTGETDAIHLHPGRLPPRCGGPVAGAGVRARRWRAGGSAVSAGLVHQEKETVERGLDRGLVTRGPG